LGFRIRTRRPISILREIATKRRGGDPFRALVEQAAIGIEQVSLDGRVLEVNPVLATVLGYEAEELRGRPLADITHPDHIAESTDLHRRLIDGTIPN
jgi:two-component system, sensor histidine kinase